MHEQWCNSQGAGPVTDYKQVVHTDVPMTPSTVICYQPKGCDVLWLGRQLQACQKATAAWSQIYS